MTPERWHEIERLYFEARARETSERPAFLDGACGGDEAIRREVESLLQHAASAGDFIEKPAVDVHLALLPDVLESFRRLNASASGQLAGRSLGVYQLNALIGAGGMGEVYRAVDTRLNRSVAIKVLPAHVSADPQRQERFKREARIVSSLNHPHVCALYDLGTEHGIDYLVMEHLEGDTLQARLTRGPLSPDHALEFSIQICDALEKAHRHGVVHRDLKPANIMLTRSGVKLLDFGAATWAAPATGMLSDTPSLDTSGPLTREGAILGTLQYLSPEQLEGTPADARSDIFAFGAVAYQMIAGSPAFAGTSQAGIIGAILKDDPPAIDEVAPQVPRRFARAIARCLAKKPDDRWQTATDLLFELRSIDWPEKSSRNPPAWPGRRSPWIERAAWTAAVLAVSVLTYAWVRSGTAQTEPARVSIALPPDLSLWATGRGSSVAISPDGRRIVFVGLSGGIRKLYVRALDGHESVPIAGTDGASSPVFSPDGLWIGFTVGTPGGTLKKVPVQGGPVLNALDTPTSTPSAGFSVSGAAWGHDDTIVFAAMNDGARGLWRVTGGGAPERLTTPREGELFHSWPQLLPDGGAVVYTIWSNTGFDGGRIALQPLAGGPATILVERGSYGRVVQVDGQRAYLVYARPEGLLAAAFDLRQRRLAGPSMAVLNGVLSNLTGGAHFAISPGGLLAYIPGGLDEANKTLVWVTREGAATELDPIMGIGFQFRISPDGKSLIRPNAIGPNRDLWVDDLSGRTAPRRLTIGGVHNFPLWTADGRRVIYSSGVPNGNLFWRAADGSGSEERLTTSPTAQTPSSVSLDGKMLAFVGLDRERAADIWLMPLQGSRQPRLFVGTPSSDSNPMISPDGEWLAYHSDVSGRTEIYVAALADADRTTPVSKGGGWRPLWSPDGDELYYRKGHVNRPGEMIAVAFATAGGKVTVGPPRVLFASPYDGEGDIAPDGRFLLLKPTPQASPARAIELVFNWFDELKTKVPVRPPPARE